MGGRPEGAGAGGVAWGGAVKAKSADVRRCAQMWNVEKEQKKVRGLIGSG